jgi:hypothetical protein
MRMKTNFISRLQSNCLPHKGDKEETFTQLSVSTSNIIKCTKYTYKRVMLLKLYICMFPCTRSYMMES